MQVELVKKATDDGLVEFEDDVPLGRKYLVDMESTRVILLLDDMTGGCHMKEIIYTVDGMWLPTECLKFVVH